MKIIQRNTEVVSISLPKDTVERLEDSRKSRGQSRSAFISALINEAVEEQRWQTIYKRGEKSAKQFKITSEEDIDRILHEA